MSEVILAADSPTAIGVDLVRSADWESVAAEQAAPVRARAAIDQFTGQTGRLLLIADADGAVTRVLFGLGEAPAPDAMAIRGLSARMARATTRSGDR